MTNRIHRTGLTVFILLFVAVFFISPMVRAATLVVANKAEATVSLINLDDGEVVATLPTGEGPHEVGISPNGKLALVSNYGYRGTSGDSLTLIDIPTASVVRTIDLGDYQSPHGVEWIDDERAAVTVEANRALIIVDAVKGQIVDMIETGQQVSHMVALAPAGRYAYTADMGSGTATVLDLQKGVRVRSITTGKGAEGITASTPGGQIWVSNRADDSISVIDPVTYAIVKEIPSTGFPIRATATVNGLVLVTRARAGELAVYDAASFDEVRTVTFDINNLGAEGRLFGDRFGDSSVPIGVVADSSGEHAYVAHANADVITEVRLSSGEIVRLLRAGREPDGMGYSSLSSQVPASH